MGHFFRMANLIGYLSHCNCVFWLFCYLIRISKYWRLHWRKKKVFLLNSFFCKSRLINMLQNQSHFFWNGLSKSSFHENHYFLHFPLEWSCIKGRVFHFFENHTRKVKNNNLKIKTQFVNFFADHHQISPKLAKI